MLARRAVRGAGRAVEWVTGRPLASYDGPVAFETKVAVARAAPHLSRLRGRTVAGLPGHVLLRADPGGLARLAQRLGHGTVLVPAGRGTTATTALLVRIAGEAGLRTVTNAGGAGRNPRADLAAELLAVTRAGRGTSGDLGVFEVEERWLPRLADDLGVRVIVLRDVPGEVATLHRALVSCPPDVRLVVNVDDPRLAPLAELRPDAVRFGLGTPSDVGASDADARAAAAGALALGLSPEAVVRGLSAG